MSNAPKTSDSSSSNNLEKKPDKSELDQIINDPSADSSLAATPERPLAYECQHCDKKYASVQALCGHQNAHRPKPPALPRCRWTAAVLTGGFDPCFYGVSAPGFVVPESAMQPAAYTGTPIYMTPLLQAMTHHDRSSYGYLVPLQAREPNWADFKRARFSGVPVMVNPIHACASKDDQFVVPEMVRANGPDTRAPNWACGNRAAQSDESGLDLSLKLSCALLNGGTTKRFDFEERDDSGLDLSLKL